MAAHVKSKHSSPSKPGPLVFVSAGAADISSSAWPGSSGQPVAHHIFTVFHFFVLAGISAGFAAGLAGGAKLFGAFGVVAGALVGSYVGFVVGRLPELLVLRSITGGLALKTADELR